jgi:hypothetical protein
MSSAQSLRDISAQLEQIIYAINDVATALEQAQSESGEPIGQGNGEDNGQGVGSVGGKAKKASKPRKAASSVASKAPAKKKK